MELVAWWGARTLGLSAYLALWVTMCLGTLTGLQPSPLHPKTANLLHRVWTVIALGLTLLHTVLSVSHESPVPVLAVFVPGASDTLTGPVAMGTLALYGFVLVGVAGFFRKRLPPKVWTWMHGAAHATWWLALAHGITAGSDTHALLMTYAATSGVVCALLVARFSDAVPSKRLMPPST